MLTNCLPTLSNTPISVSVLAPTSLSSSFLHPSPYLTSTQISLHGRSSRGITSVFKGKYGKTRFVRGGGRILCGLLPVDPWTCCIFDSKSVTNLLFALSLFPYLGFLYFISRVKSAPKLTLFGFHFLLVFVGATIPVGIYEKVQYGTSLSNVDWLHGGAESLLALSNLFVVLGLRKALRKCGD